MPQTRRRQPRRPSGGERVFAADDGRLWSALHQNDELAVVFTCISDSRQSNRAIVAEAGLRIADVSDDTLRAWLREAPRVGRLT